MLNEVIKKKLSPEIRVLYEVSRHKLLHSPFHAELKKAIKAKKSTLKDTKDDRLKNKLDHFGNKGAWAVSKIKELNQKLYEDKSPEGGTIGNWLSVEIECIFKNKKAESGFILFVKKAGYGKFVTIKDDASIKPNEKCNMSNDDGMHESDEGEEYECDCAINEFGREIIVSFEYGQWDMITNICNELDRLQVYVNKSCGFHVHFDCRHLTKTKVMTLAKRAALSVPVLKSILPKSRRDNEYCEQDINSFDDRSYRGRYAFVNLHSFKKHGTLEIRGHSGTINANKIINWIKILKKVMTTRNKTKFTSVGEFITYFKFENTLADYIINRHAKFNLIEEKKGDDVQNDHFLQELLSEAIPNNPNLPMAYTVRQLGEMTNSTITLSNGTGVSFINTDEDLPF